MARTEEELEMLERHDELIHHNILPRLEEVEKSQLNVSAQVQEITSQVKEIKSSQTNLELTIMKDGQETRGILSRFMEHYFEVDMQKMKMKSDVIHKDERITLKRFSTREKIVLGIVGAFAGTGGILAGIAGLLQILK
ncbi:hypothetical protein [Sporosarcina sp. FSL K6-3508]|uniref:hypothetical protein n=1 Tax=Sporosarcina sp. FSL K6-3508 TaxID=2921557 RepID=UPI00315B287F